MILKRIKMKKKLSRFDPVSCRKWEFLRQILGFEGLQRKKNIYLEWRKRFFFSNQIFVFSIIIEKFKNQSYVTMVQCICPICRLTRTDKQKSLFSDETHTSCKIHFWFSIVQCCYRNPNWTWTSGLFDSSIDQKSCGKKHFMAEMQEKKKLCPQIKQGVSTVGFEMLDQLCLQYWKFYTQAKSYSFWKLTVVKFNLS